MSRLISYTLWMALALPCFACKSMKNSSALNATDVPAADNSVPASVISPVTPVEQYLIPAERDIDAKFETYEGGSAEHEQELNAQIAGFAIQLLTNNRDKYPKIPRDAHSKSHGCLKATFAVDNTALPPEMRQGVFATNASYDAYVRFSNNDHLPMRKDFAPDVRGMAIKVMGVAGEKILLGHESDMNVDFLMYGSKKFFIADIAGYVSFFKALRDNDPAKVLLTEHPIAAAELATAQTAQLPNLNPLQVSYYSATPVRLGALDNPDRTAIKYAATPCSSNTIVNTSGIVSHNYMRENLVNTLQESGHVCFEFKIQPQLFPEVMPVEDATVLWPDKAGFFGANAQKFSPFIKVATVTMTQDDNQGVANPYDMSEKCEDMSFSPWRTISAHKPLGRTMRMRRDVYNATSTFRRTQNGASQTEPSN